MDLAYSIPKSLTPMIIQKALHCTSDSQKMALGAGLDIILYVELVSQHLQFLNPP